MPDWHNTQPWCFACFDMYLPRRDRLARPAYDEECCMCAKPLFGKNETIMAHTDKHKPRYPTVTKDGERVPVVPW